MSNTEELLEMTFDSSSTVMGAKNKPQQSASKAESDNVKHPGRFLFPMANSMVSLWSVALTVSGNRTSPSTKCGMKSLCLHWGNLSRAHAEMHIFIIPL